ncbi:MAG: SWIM zinc finger family protein [Oscillospiraceae bacterium]
MGGCTCPAFERTRIACKHIAALMIENMARQEYEREARQRQQEYEKRRREEQARENEAFINRMIQLGEKGAHAR